MNTPEENGSEGEDKNGDESEAGKLFEAYGEAVESEDVEAQKEAVLKIWSQMAQEDKKPDPWLDAMGEAHQWEATFDWVGAEKAYKRAVEVAESATLQSQAYSALTSLYSLLNKEELALEAAQAATKAMRQSNIIPLLSHRLEAEARLYLKANDFARAWDKIDEALASVKNAVRNKLGQADVLVLCAGYLIRKGEFAKAQTDLEAAWKLMEPYGEWYFAAGWQGAMAGWWAATALLRAEQDDLRGAVEAWREVVQRRRIIAQLPQLEGPYKHNSLSVSLRNLGRALRRVEDDAADLVFEESRSLRYRIGLAPLEE